MADTLDREGERVSERLGTWFAQQNIPGTTRQLTKEKERETHLGE